MNRLFGTLLSLLVGTLFLASVEARACLSAPPENNAYHVNQGIKMIGDHLYMRLYTDDIKIFLLKANVIKYQWIKSKAAFECHDYEELEYIYNVHYKKGGQECEAVYSYRVKNGKYDGAPPRVDELKVREGPRCDSAD